MTCTFSLLSGTKVTSDGSTLLIHFRPSLKCYPLQRPCRMASPHDRSRKDDEDDPVEQMISRTGCAELHYAIQECMAEHQDWRACQSQVQTFKDCMMNFQKARKEQLRQHQPPSTKSAAS
uniref:Cytochrome c oxidase assembly factor 4 homolog n=2 Tax=Haplochromini TaxID=319058 RepID=A0A3Q2WM41_HAPBU